MKKIILMLCILSAIQYAASAQETGPGIGIYPTGTETGLGFRSSKNKRWAADVRITKASLLSEPTLGSMVNEASLICRVVRYEKLRLHIGLGLRADWNFDRKQPHRYGAVIPVGVEAFPFPFQNAGLFFEAAPYFTTNGGSSSLAGIRTVAGFAFYFIKKEKK